MSYSAAPTISTPMTATTANPTATAMVHAPNTQTRNNSETSTPAAPKTSNTMPTTITRSPFMSLPLERSAPENDLGPTIARGSQ